MVLR
jgi:hypothetical protein